MQGFSDDLYGGSSWLTAFGRVACVYYGWAVFLAAHSTTETTELYRTGTAHSDKPLIHKQCHEFIKQQSPLESRLIPT
jgi:hypothetical protein